jgi:hypothetical protein
MEFRKYCDPNWWYWSTQLHIYFTSNGSSKVISSVAVDKHMVSEVCSIIANPWKIYVYFHCIFLNVWSPGAVLYIKCTSLFLYYIHCWVAVRKEIAGVWEEKV